MREEWCTFGLNPPCQLVIRYQWLAFLNQALKQSEDRVVNVSNSLGILSKYRLYLKNRKNAKKKWRAVPLSLSVSAWRNHQVSQIACELWPPAVIGNDTYIPMTYGAIIILFSPPCYSHLWLISRRHSVR